MTIRTGATFSDDGKYRYRLWRRWDENVWPVMLLMLNPSTADAIDNDPTISRCIERAKRLGWGGVEICNLYAFRSTDPQALYRGVMSGTDIVGPDNIAEILAASKMTKACILAWGSHGKVIPGWPETVVEALKDANLFTLKINKDGSPQHPLYLPYDIDPEPFL